MRNLTFLILALLSLAPLSAATSLYLEPRVSSYWISGELDVGDRGTDRSDNLPRAAWAIALGYRLTPTIALEARYTQLDGIEQRKQAPSWPIFGPPSQVILPMIVDYTIHQDTDLFTLALPIRIATRGAWTFEATPMVHYERSAIRVLNDIPINPLAIYPHALLYQDTETGVRFGGELAVSYRLSARFGLRAHYSLSAIEDVQLHQAGLGVIYSF